MNKTKEILKEVAMMALQEDEALKAIYDKGDEELKDFIECFVLASDRARAAVMDEMRKDVKNFEKEC